jgi:hypothetical protein
MEVVGQPHVPASLRSGKKLRYSLNKSLGGFGSWSERCGEEKYILLLPGFGPRIVLPVDYAVPMHSFELPRIIAGCKCWLKYKLVLCGDGFMDFIYRPKSKILKLKIKITKFRKLAVLPSSGEWRGRREEHLLGGTP